MNELEQALQWFVEDKRIMACLTVTGGTAESECHAACGRIREKEASGEDVPLGEDTLFDLASLTKIFTGMAVLRLREEDFDTVINTNLKGTFLCMKAVARQMVKQRYGDGLRATVCAPGGGARGAGAHLLRGADLPGPH